MVTIGSSWTILLMVAIMWMPVGLKYPPWMPLLLKDHFQTQWLTSSRWSWITRWTTLSCWPSSLKQMPRVKICFSSKTKLTQLHFRRKDKQMWPVLAKWTEWNQDLWSYGDNIDWRGTESHWVGDYQDFSCQKYGACQCQLSMFEWS